MNHNNLFNFHFFANILSRVSDRFLDKKKMNNLTLTKVKMRLKFLEEYSAVILFTLLFLFSVLFCNKAIYHH